MLNTLNNEVNKGFYFYCLTLLWQIIVKIMQKLVKYRALANVHIKHQNRVICDLCDFEHSMDVGTRRASSYDRFRLLSDRSETQCGFLTL